MTATNEPPKPAPVDLAKKPTEKRDYLVLREIESSGPFPSYEQIGIGQGATDIEAIKDATSLLRDDDRDGTFVAIPTRSFRPRKRKVETVQKDLWA